RGDETGTQRVTPAAATWYPLPHATSGAQSTRGPSLPRREPVRGEDAPLRPGRRLRGVPARHDRRAPAAPDPYPLLLHLVQPLALRGLAPGRWRGHGLLPLAGAHPCDALAGRPPDGGLRACVSGALQELPGAERRASADRPVVRRAECPGGRLGRAGRALA